MSTPKIIPHKAAKTVAVVGEKYVLLVTGQDTGGKYAIVEGFCTPQGGPPPHFHTREDENFYVLAGEVEFMVEGKLTKVGPGTTVSVPKGTLHTYKALTPGTRILVEVVPAGLEAFFAEVGEPIPNADAPVPPVTEAHIQKVIATAPKYGIEIKL